MLTLDNVYRASYALKGVIRKTDVIYAPKLSQEANIYLKTENLQITGSFMNFRARAGKESPHFTSTNAREREKSTFGGRNRLAWL